MKKETIIIRIRSSKERGYNYEYILSNNKRIYIEKDCKRYFRLLANVKDYKIKKEEA